MAQVPKEDSAQRPGRVALSMPFPTQALAVNYLSLPRPRELRRFLYTSLLFALISQGQTWFPCLQCLPGVVGLHLRGFQKNKEQVWASLLAATWVGKQSGELPHRNMFRVSPLLEPLNNRTEHVAKPQTPLNLHNIIIPSRYTNFLPRIYGSKNFYFPSMKNSSKKETCCSVSHSPPPAHSPGAVAPSLPTSALPLALPLSQMPHSSPASWLGPSPQVAAPALPTSRHAVEAEPTYGHTRGCRAGSSAGPPSPWKVTVTFSLPCSL